MVGGMNANLADFDQLKNVGTGFKEAFSDRDFQGKDSNYPYSEQYFRDRQKDAVRMMKRAGIDVIDNIRGVNLDGSSGSEAVRQARQNAGNIIENPNKVELGNDSRK